MTRKTPKPRTYAELYAVWRDEVATELEEAPEAYREDDSNSDLIVHDIGRKVIPEDADFAWAARIIASKPGLATEVVHADGATLRGFALATIRQKVVRDLLKEFEPVFDRLRREGDQQDPSP
ncbi:MAG: hypothetical protein BGO82_01220 [Devosia sp. 67-54]|uniref:hypothetical protein n=1 Tax=unclassified Devosia TaxID=196773 RepID=UPI0009680861|nr:MULTISPECIES: hypothetical protein [unclassified Devosia]MBN9305915.1 hypothetical protein [Devosia sp.]OJX16394.1 MAG: hypothetical protein BGO82_01220 [Devosia sp. 67-54]